MTAAEPGNAADSIRHWLWCGLAAGFLLGLIEGTERAITLRPFLPGMFEPIALWVVSVGFVMLAGAAAGAVVALVAGGLQLPMLRRPGAAGLAGRVLIGTACGAAAGGWVLLALTLTSRFDRILDRSGAFAIACAVTGGLVAPLLAAIGRRWFAAPRGAPARVLGYMLLPMIALLYVVNLLFAPQSSVGVHVVLDTCVLLGAVCSIRLLTAAPRRGRLLRAWAALALLLMATHFVMEASPRIASLAKTRGSTSRRAIRATAWLLDFDRDGLAPRWLTAGWDTSPFDPLEPRDWVRRLAGLPLAHAPSPALEAAPDRQPPRAPIRRILLVTIDALRADAARGDRPSPLGAVRPATPVLDSLAARSAAFAAAYAPSAGTEDTFTSLFSDAALPGVIDRDPPHGWLADRIAAAGYRRAAFVDYASFARAAWGWPRIELRPAGEPAMGDSAVDALLHANAFVWVHWMPLHAKVLSPLSAQSYFAEPQRRRYAEGLAQVDTLLGRMLARLRASGMAESTLVVLSADHGEELGGHGHYHHNLSLYEPAVRVPLWISGPGVIPGDRPDIVPQRDLYPTLIEAAGLDAGTSPSRSLWPALADPAHRMAEAPVYLFLPQRGFSRGHSWISAMRGQAALVDPVAGRKVIYGIGRERFEAFDLAADPGERVNLWGTRTAWVPVMAAALDSALDANLRPPPVATP
jgi:arylsulfatase A-like enzyme